MQSSVRLRPYVSVGQPPISEPSTVPHSAALIVQPCMAALNPQSSWIVPSVP